MKQKRQQTARPVAANSGDQPRRSQQGSSLIEVMVSVLLLSIGLIGSTQLITTAIREQSALRYRSVAMNIAQGLAERIRANRQGVVSGQYVDMNSSGIALDTPNTYSQARTLVTGQSSVSDANCCTDAKVLAKWDVDNVELSLKTSLPGAALSLRIPKDGTVPVPNARLIVVAWIEPIFDIGVVLNDNNNGCPAGFNADTSASRENVRCLQYRFQL